MELQAEWFTAVMNEGDLKDAEKVLNNYRLEHSDEYDDYEHVNFRLNYEDMAERLYISLVDKWKKEADNDNRDTLASAISKFVNDSPKFGLAGRWSEELKKQNAWKAWRVLDKKSQKAVLGLLGVAIATAIQNDAVAVIQTILKELFQNIAEYSDIIKSKLENFSES